MNKQNGLKESEVPLAEARRALERVLASRAFASSNRLSRFLRYAVEQMLAGNADVLKEYTIGTHAYDRKTDFDPSHDTIVRTEARRLRNKLKDYYEGEGVADNVLIFFRLGSYVPVIHWRKAVEGSATIADPKKGLSSSELWKEGDGVWVAVEPFLSQGADEAAASFAFGLGEEILHRLSNVKGVRVVLGGLKHSSQAQAREGAPAPLRSEVHIVIGGTVRFDQGQLRATVRVAAVNGLLLWSQRFDASRDQIAITKMQENIAATLLSRIAPRETIVQRFAVTPTETLYKLYSEVLAAESLSEECSHASLTKALQKFEELKERAPEYPRLDCGIVQCCLGLAQRGGFPPEGLAARANSVAQELVVKYPDLPEAHSVLGMTKAQEWKWEAAERSFRTAISLGSQHSIHRQFAILLLVLGRFEESWEQLQVAQEMDPLSARQKVSMARFFYYSRWHSEARDHYRDSADHSDMPLDSAYYQALALSGVGLTEEALAIAERLQRRAGSILPYTAGIAELYAICGKHALATEIADRRGLLDASSAYSSFRKARLAITLNQPELALEFLQRSWEQREPELPFLAVDVRFDPLREHEAVAATTKQIFAD